MLIPADRIRALGIEWPPSPNVAASCAPLDGSPDGAIDLTTVLAKLEDNYTYLKHQQEEMYTFARQNNADVDDISDRSEELSNKMSDYRSAIAVVKKLLATPA